MFLGEERIEWLLKILVLNYEYPPIGGGGGAVSKQVAAKLAERGYEMIVQTAHWGDLPKESWEDGVHVYRHFAFRRRQDRCTIPQMMMYILCGFWPTWRRIRKEKPDLLHVHFAVPTGVLAWILSILTGVPYVLTAHLGDVPGGVPEQTDRWFKIIQPFAKQIWRRAAAATAVSDFVRHLAEASYMVPVKMLPNGVDIPGEEGLQLDLHDPPRLLFAGRFNPQKNLRFLVKVLSKLRHLPWYCRILGDGPEMRAVRKEIQEAELSHRIALPGWQEQKAVDAAMSESDILLMPSHSEGLPVVAAKALGFGLAIVGSNIGGLKDVVVPRKNGLLLDKDNLESFTKDLGALLQDPERMKAMKIESRKHAIHFEIDHIIDGYEAVFAKALKAQKS